MQTSAATWGAWREGSMAGLKCWPWMTSRYGICNSGPRPQRAITYNLLALSAKCSLVFCWHANPWAADFLTNFVQVCIMQAGSVIKKLRVHQLLALLAEEEVWRVWVLTWMLNIACWVVKKSLPLALRKAFLSLTSLGINLLWPILLGFASHLC